jgi:DNA-binding transcriptional LysR family regulator
MHPRLLRTFLAVARSRNITRAAEAVHLAQSSVSDQIQTLETELGVDLFARSKRGLTLTPAGAALGPYAENILALEDEARAAVRMVAGQEAGSVTLGALETIASAWLPQRLSRLHRAHPGLEMRLKVAETGALLRKLEDGEIDLAFCFDRGGFDGKFGWRKIAAEPLVVITSPDREGLAGRRDDLEALAAMPFVVTEAGCVYRLMFDKAFADAGLAAPRIAAEAGSLGAIGRLVAEGVGIAVVPRLAVADALSRGDVREQPWPVPDRTAALVAVWRRRRVQPPALQWALAALSEDRASVRSAGARPRHEARFRS